MTRFNIAAMQEQGMTRDEINNYIRQQEAAIFGPRPPRGGGGSVTPPRPVKGGPVKGGGSGPRWTEPPKPGKGGTGYDIGTPMPGPAITSPGGTRADLGRPTLEDIGKPGIDITGPRPPRPADDETPDLVDDSRPSLADIAKPKSGGRTDSKESFQNLLGGKQRKSVRRDTASTVAPNEAPRLAKFEEMLQALKF